MTPYVLTEHVARALRDSDHRIVITGAGGWLGLATLELLGNALGPDLGGRVHCFGASARTLNLLTGQTIAQRPLAELADLPPAPTLLLHLAFLTKDRAETMDEAEYRRANRAMSGDVLALLDRIGTEAAFVASSGAARFADDPRRSAAMRLYGELKRDDEERFAGWAGASGKRAVITRIFNISGPHINKLHSYALSALLLEAMAGRPPTVTAPHRVVRGYVAIRELMSLVFATLIKPADEVVIRFDSGGEPLELADVARVIARKFGLTAAREPMASNIEDCYVGDPAIYSGLLTAIGVLPVPFAQQVSETHDYLVTLPSPEPDWGC